MTSGSNILPHLAADVAKLHREAEGFEKEAIKKALAAGRKLNEAKAMTRHGEWSEWLATTGIGERTAQRYMRRDRCALNSDTVTDLGGIGATLEWLKPVQLPPKGSILLASADGFDPEGNDLMGFVWPEGKGYHVAMLDLRPEWPHMKKTNRAIVPAAAGETPIWLTLWSSFDWRLKEMTFETISDRPNIEDVVSMVQAFHKDSPGAGR
ncbi:DUF3102 domain-containing protein [Paenirhodobacter populi]|uniref:DUF3102 domain-containing protein n=1 Tax=Paenirhodobacter populi TaxID=2306993 RepID=A0A443IPN3_9RHOB|nr:DUF3102 domain-containing protein [Sinirhodobacter populi]RWR08481.1 DUF3102 domain-containing protein [Sinirhodobacter populi]